MYTYKVMQHGGWSAVTKYVMVRYVIYSNILFNVHLLYCIFIENNNYIATNVDRYKGR